MKTFAAFLLLSITLSLYSGCSEDTVSTNNYTIKDVFPLADSNKWTYQSTSYNADGTIYGTKDSFTLSFDSVVTFNGLPAFLVANSEGNVLYYSGPNLYSGDMKSNNSQLFFRYPMNINETIVTEDTLYSSGYRSKNYLRYISDNTTITVPAGTFNCIGYETIGMYGLDGALDTTSRRNDYFAFGIGIIKETNYQISSIDSSSWYLSYTMELVTHN